MKEFIVLSYFIILPSLPVPYQSCWFAFLCYPRMQGHVSHFLKH